MKQPPDNIIEGPWASPPDPTQVPCDTEGWPLERLDLNPEVLAEAAKDTAAIDCFKRAQSDRLRDIVIIGTTPEGEFSIDSSCKNLTDVVFELHRAMIEINDQIRSLGKSEPGRAG